MKRQISIILLSVSLLLLAACGGGAAPAGESTAPTASGSAPVATTAPASSTEETDEQEPTEESSNPTGSKETRKVDDLSDSLSKLDSYHLTFSYSYKGTTDAGETQEGTIMFDQKVDRKNDRGHINFTSSGEMAGGTNGTMDMYEIEGTTYIVTTDAENKTQCISTSSDDSSSSMGAIFDPSDLVGGLEQAKLEARGETVNGVKADRYSFEEQGAGLGIGSTASGEVWIAQDGEFVVKYIGSASSNQNIGLSDTELKDVAATWEYNVVDVNSTVSVELPEECANSGLSSDVPVPANAAEKASFGPMMTFASSDDVATVTEFYKSELASNGWTEVSANGMGDMQILEYSKDNRKLTVTISKAESGNGSQVMLMTSEE